MSQSTPRKSFESNDGPISPSSRHHGFPFPTDHGSPRFGVSRMQSSRRSSLASLSSFNSTTNSIGGALDIQGRRNDSTVRELGQNAISNLLQGPIVRTGLLTGASSGASSYRAPTTRDIPPVTLTNIPHVEPSAFKEYLTKIGPLFESLQRGRAELEAQSAARDGDVVKSQEIADGSGTAAKEISSPVLSRVGSSTLLSPMESPQPRRRSSAYSRRRANEPTPLSTIPNVYFDEDFHLENPRIFDVVSERAEIIRPAPGTQGDEKQSNGAPLPPRKALATNAILQEKMSWYMDTVEVHLINAISAASTSFFAALGSLKDLQNEASESVAKIEALRADLAALDQGMALGGMEIARMRQRRENVKKLSQATAQIQRVVDQIIHCENLVDSGEFEAAANGVLDVDRLITGEDVVSPTSATNGTASDHDHGELIDLRELKALQGLSNGMMQLQYRIGKGFETRFLEALLGDLRRHLEKVPPQETMKRWASASLRARGDHRRVPTGMPQYLDTGPQFRENLQDALNGLGRSGHTAQATAAFREAIMREMKSLIRKYLPSSTDDDAESMTSVSTRAGKVPSQQEKSAILARNLRALDEKDSEDLLINIYTNVSEALRRLSVQVKVLLDVTSTFDRRPSRSSSPEPNASTTSPTNTSFQSIDGNLRPPQRPASPSVPRLQEQLSEILDMSALLGQAVDVAQTQTSRVLKVRAEQTHNLPLERFLRYFTINRFFADECEAISGRSGQGLKNIVTTQLNAFVSTMGDNETQRIAQQLDSDQWEAKDFQEKDQAILARLLEGMNADPDIWTKGTRVWEEPSSEPGNTQSASNGVEEPAPPAKPQVRSAYIDETRYVLVASAVSLLPTLDNFMALIASIPGIASSAIPALAEVLRTFNSRSSQLILGAGATRIAGLKNITTKHLALSSQALSFVIALIPYMRESVRRHTGGRADALQEFDKVKRLYQDHQMGIHDKLVEIMTSRATAHINSMKKIDFAADKFASPSAYMETLTKETGTLHRVLGRHLAEPDIFGIMSQIAKSYKDLWSKGFDEVELSSQLAKDRLIKDVELFEARLDKVQGFAEVAKALMNQVKTRQVKNPDVGVALEKKAEEVKEPEKDVEKAA